MFGSQNFELMDTSRLMSCKKYIYIYILLVIVDLKVDCSFMYQIALWLNVESSASLLSHPFIFLTLGLCFPQPRPQGLLAFQYGGSRSEACEQALHLGASREVTQGGRAFSHGSFRLTLRAFSQAQGFH